MFTVVAMDDKNDIYTLHKTGCRDLERLRATKHMFNAPDEADTVAKAIDWWLDDELRELGYSENDFRVLPCCRK